MQVKFNPPRTSQVAPFLHGLGSHGFGGTIGKNDRRLLFNYGTFLLYLQYRLAETPESVYNYEHGLTIVYIQFES